MQGKGIGVVGAGAMGNGIAQAFAVAGYQVTMTDIAEAQLQRGLATVSSSLDRLIKKEKMTAADKTAVLSRITTSTDLSSLARCDLIIEAASENLDLKLRIFAQLDEIAKPDTLLASNTSSISITRIAAATKRPRA